MNKVQYLERLGYSGGLEPNLETLKELQKTHLLNVPFENLDIHYQVPIILDIPSIFDKIVVHYRGGFCYELNGLFFELLTALGFNAKRISARVYDKENGFGQEFDHFAIIVNIKGKEYLSDVGFGEFSFEPLKLEIGVIQNDSRGSYIIDKYDDAYLSVSHIINEEKTPEYIFKKTEREFIEYKEMCAYHQTSPKSHFTQKRLITLPTNNGRVTISGAVLKIKEHDSVTEKLLKDKIEFNNELWNYFKIKLK